GSTGDSYDNAMAESINGLYKAEVIHRKSWKNRAEVELATLTWGDWYIDNGREDWKRISASMRKQPDALRYDRQTIFGLVRERPIDIHKDPVA
uniref:integrase core domain-containing protein n=1 Tax=Escherichia coli TaxID=562 RepID=UPI002023964D